MITYENGDDTISTPEITTLQIQEQLVRDDITNELYMPLSSTIVLKRNKEMLYVPLDFENGLTIDALVVSGAYVSVMAHKELDRIKQQAPSNILKFDDPPNFQIQVANGQLEKPTATATLKFDIGDHIFAEHFVVMKNLTGPIIGLPFTKHNSVVIDFTHRLIHFPHLTMQNKSASSQASAKPQPVPIHESITIPQMTTKTITAFVDHSSEWNTTGTVTPVEKFTEAASLIISHSMSTIIERKIAVRVTNTTESPYTINKNTQIAEVSVLTPKQSKFFKPVDTAIFSMIPEGDPDLVTYLTELLRMNKPVQQNNTFWFPTPKNPGNTEDHTPIQTRILTELRELQRSEKLNPKDDSQSRMEFFKRFDWTDTLLTQTEKQAVEDILVEYHDLFARNRMDIGMNTEFKVKLTPNDDKAVYSQSLPMPIHLNEYLIVELALMHKYGIITVLLFSKYGSPIFAQRKPNGKLRLLVDLRKINTLIADDYTNNNRPVSTLSDAAQHLTGSHYCVSLIAPKRIIACRWRTNVRWKCSHSILLVELLPTEDLHKVLADLCLLFRVSCASTWTQLSKLTDVLNTWMTANNAMDFTRNIRAFFKCIRDAGFFQCHFGVRQVEFIGRTISSEGVLPQSHKIQNFLNKMRFPKSKKALQRYLGFVNYYKNSIPRMAEKLNPIHKLLKAEVPINITSELKETFDSVNKALSNACKLALKQPIPGKQLVLMMQA